MFYTYDQNNSGGWCAYDDEAGISEFVIIEAESARVADARAQDIGLYFDGVDRGRDCECCGDRWYEAGYRGTDQPEIYSTPADDFKPHIDWSDGEHPIAWIHYADGTKREVWPAGKRDTFAL